MSLPKYVPILIGVGVFLLLSQRAKATALPSQRFTPVARPVRPQYHPTIKKPTPGARPRPPTPRFVRKKSPTFSRRKKIMWQPPQTAAPYIAWLDAAEKKYNLPRLLVHRVAYQESRFRPDIIKGEKVSSANAKGIMQIVERWHPTVNPLDPKAAIFYGAKYLRENYDRFGSWSKALAAYNAGPTKLSNFLRGKIPNLPAETVNYVKEIQGDVLA